MSPLPLLETLAIGVLLQTGPQEADRLMAMAEEASHQELVAETRLHPEESREAFRELLRASPTAPPPSAGRLAAAYSEAWTDPFLVNRYQRFLGWSVEQRTSKLAADSLRRVGNEAYVSGSVEQALGPWRESLVLLEALDDTSGVARSLGNIGAGYYGGGQLDSATAYYERSQELALAAGDFVAAANALTVLALLSKDAGDLTAAGALGLRALGMHERVGAVRSAGFDHHNLGLVALSLGDLEGARRQFEDAIEISQRTGRQDDEADHLSSLADVMLAGGQYQEAEDVLSRALDLDLQTGNRLGEAGVRHSMGLLMLVRGDYVAAVRELQAALGIYQSMGRVADAVSAQADLARARAATGDVRRGTLDLREAGRLAESGQLGPAIRADLALASGDFALLLNEYDEAQTEYREAERLYRGQTDYAGIAAALHGQAYVHLYQTRFADAVEALDQALRSQQSLGDPRAAALTHLLLADVHLEAGETDRARLVASDARDVLAALGDPVGEAAALAVLAQVEMKTGQYEAADSLYRQALALVAGTDAPGIAWRLHSGRAETLAARGQYAEAEKQLRRAIDEIERGAGTWTHTRSGAGYLADKWEVYARLAQLESRLGEVEWAFATSERLRAQKLLAMLDRGRIGAAVPEAALVSREQDLRLRMAELTAWLEPGRGPEGPLRGPGATTLTGEQASAALERTRREYALVLEDMRSAGTEHVELVKPELVSAPDLARHLASDELFLEYLVTDSSVLVFGMTTDGLQSVEIPETRQTLEDLIGFTRGVLADAARDSGTELWRVPLQRLHGILIEPLVAAGWLDGREHLIVVPHGELHYLPFQALIDDGGTFLVERFSVSYAPSATVWAELGARPSAVRGGGILAMAPRVAELPATRREMARIQDAYGDQAAILLGAEATEEALASTAGTYDVLHLATYGVLNRTNPLFSYVELGAGLNSDGRLEAHEIFGLRLDADLVVLSACETGVGSGSRADVPPGDDWVGLVRSFLSAGAAEVVATLWRVEDRATADLMGSFYQLLASGEQARSALAAAQRQMLQDPATASPFYWAGFVLVGQSGGSP
jgi:CHAT domain-containing protein/tetratricopeptide (TPR) repeat protein